NKYLMRAAFQGMLPDAVLRRPKTSLRADPVLARAMADGLPNWRPVPSLLQYVDPDLVNTMLQESVLHRDRAALWDNLRPISLNLFLAFNKVIVGESSERNSTE